MHTDARNMDNDSLIEGDICIIGAGAAGLTMAMEWINTPYKVVLLEGGGFDYDDKVQELYRGKNTGQHYYPLKSTRLHYFGGTTGHWGGFCSIFDAIDFTKRDWVDNSGWPITLEDVIPFYKRAHDYLDLGHYDYSSDYWLTQDSHFKKLDFDDKVIWNKVWRFSAPTRFGTKYREPVLKSSNIHLYTYANVVDIQANDNISSINQVIVKNYAGKTHRVKAKYFILACNAIQNARVLLATTNQAPKGLGNDNDLVGRYFMEHVEVKSATLILKEAQALYYYQLNVKARVELAISAEKQKELKILNGTASLMPLSVAEKMKPVIETWASDDPRESKKVMHDAHNNAEGSKISQIFESDKHHAFELTTRIEQVPNPLSRVSLDTEKDSLGMPRAMLNWAFTSLEKHSVRTMYQLIGQQAGIKELGRLQIMDYLRDPTDNAWPSYTGGGWHHMGTTRMSDDPKTGVVDADCKMHGVNNLFIAGSSTYTTAAAVNPTLTIVALSIRLSDHLKEKIKTN